LVHYAQAASVEDAKAAVESAVEAFKASRDVTYSRRRELLMKVADILESRVDELARY
jgi:acyl-CoA reductase-like NAD-dependent aldehyde dehydrogenase